MPTPPTLLSPDPKACAVAQAVGDAVRPDRVILFGSRARGDFSPNSDIDLLIITDSDPLGRQKYLRTSAAAHRKVDELYDNSIDVELVRMSEQTFHDGRRARNHVAGQAVRDGFDANGGSRARGDFSPNSDIDLLIITDSDPLGRQKYLRTSAAAHCTVDELYGDSISVDLVHMSEGAFHYGRRARNHVAGQAVRDGFDANGNKASYDNPDPTNWPDIRQRVANAERELGVLKILVEANSAQEAIGFHAQQALENALKGWISALDGDYRNTHDLAILAATVRRHPAENDTPAGEKLAWLTEYAVRYRYADAEVVIEDRYTLLSAVAETVEAIMVRIRALT